MQDIGELETCEATQLHAKALLAKSDGCLGSDVSNWKPSDIRTIGVVIGSSTSTSANVALFLPVSNECRRLKHNRDKTCLYNRVVKLPVIYVGGKLPVTYR